MPKLIAKKSFSYATRALRSGDEFEASSRDAKILTTIGRAAYPPTVLPPVPEPAAPPAAAPQYEAPARVKRQYHRRDLTAEK